jgi:hypothetical protein
MHFSKCAISRLENFKVMIAVLNLFEGHAKRELQENTRRYPTNSYPMQTRNGKLFPHLYHLISKLKAHSGIKAARH